MLSLRLYRRGEFRIVDEPLPDPGPDEELVKVTAVGICGSDLHWFEEGNIGDHSLERPLILGHESAGVIHSGPRKGVRVAIDPAINCQTCRHCRDGNPNFCSDMHFSGHGHQDGALREFIAWPSRLLHPLPAELTDVEGAMLEPLGVAIHTVDLAKLSPGNRVGIFGCGPIGLLIQQVARARGARVLVATDLKEHRLRAALDLGAEHAVEANTGEAVERIAAIAAEDNLDVAFEAATSSNAVEDAFKAVRVGGKAVLCGIPADNRISFDAATARRKGLTIRMVRRMRHTYPEAIGLAVEKEVDLPSLVSRVFPMAQSEEAFRVAARREALKIVIAPSR